MEKTAKITQIDGVSGRQIFEAFVCLERKINLLLDQSQRAPLPGYLNRKDVAKLLGVSGVTVCDWTNKGLLKAYRLGNKVFYKADQIDRAMVEIDNEYLLKSGKKDIE